MTARIDLCTLLAVLLPVSACKREQSVTYGFIATLGNDTTSVERVTRTGNRIVSDAVGRSPLVVKRHWEATLAPDGSITHWTMDTYVPNAAPPTTPEIHHVANFTDNTIYLANHTKTRADSATYKRAYSVTVPWNAFIYGTYEVLFNVARNRADTTHIGQYFFEGWDEGHIGYAMVRKLGNGNYSISSTGLAGEGVGHLDESGRLLSYSGEGTTYKQEVKRITDVPDIDAIATRFAADEKAKGVARSLSVRDTARATIGNTRLEIDYGRPLARGRTLVGGLLPYDQVWRTGANAATQLIISAPIQLAGVNLDAGTYTLWTIPSAHDVKLIINRQNGQWGTEYSPQQDIARAVMRADTLQAPVEKFTMRIEPDVSASKGQLVIEWGTFRWSAPVVLQRRPRDINSE